MQNPKFAEEHFKKCFKSKEYVFPSGRIDKIQGYEHYALDFLLNNTNICEFDIITGCKNVFSLVAIKHHNFMSVIKLFRMKF